MAAITNATVQLIRQFTQYEYRYVGFLTLTRQRKAVPTRIYRQAWVKDSAAADVGSPGGSYTVYRTEYQCDYATQTAWVESEWRDETGSWAAG